MLLLIVILIFGSLFSVFAAQNNTPVDVTFLTYSLPQVPVYLIAFFSLWVGVMITWLINAPHILGKTFSLKDKDKKLAEEEMTKAQLTKRVHKLEMQNKKYQKKLGIEEDERAL